MPMRLKTGYGSMPGLCRNAAAALIAVAVLGLTGAAPAWAAPAAASGAAPSAAMGEAISAQCAACHGSAGIALDTSTPNLAGQHYEYMMTQLKAYADGSRKSPIMNALIRPLSQQQMEALSAYYASIPIQVGPAAAQKR